MQLKLKVAGRGGGHGHERFIGGVVIGRNRAPGQQTVELVLAVFTQPAQIKHRDHPGCERIVARGEQIAAVHRNLHEHPVLFEIGVFEVQPHAIGKADLADAEHGFAHIADHCSGGAKVGVAKTADCGAFGRRDWRAQRLTPGIVQIGSAIGWRHPTLKPDQRLIERNGLALKRRHHRIRRNLRDKSFEPIVRIARGVGHHLVVDQRQHCAKQLRIIARGFGIGGIAVRGADDRNLLIHLLRGEAVQQCAVIFLPGLNQAAAPLPVDRVDRQFSRAAFAEQVTGPVARAAKRRVGLAAAAQHAAVDNRIADLPQQVFAALRQIVRLHQPSALAGDRNALGQGRIDEHIGQPLRLWGHRTGQRHRFDRSGRPIGKFAAELGFDLIGIEISDHEHRHVARHIFARPKAFEPRRSGGHQRFMRPNRQPRGQL